MNQLTQKQAEEIARELHDTGYTHQYIEKVLIQKGATKEMCDEALTFKKEISKKAKHKNGNYLIIIGLLLLGIGFILNVTLFYSSAPSFHYVMYGITSIGIILTILGLAMAFGDL